MRNPIRSQLPLLVVALCAGLTAAASAAVLSVPTQYATIQDAISAAVAGDTVEVADGTYSGTGNVNLNFGGKAIKVQSVNGPSTCIIDCAGGARGFSFSGSYTQATVVDGFTITNGYVGAGGGIVCQNGANPIIRNCIITNCSASNGQGGGIYCSSATPAIQNCTISGCYAAYAGGGIYCYSSDPVIQNCVISTNSANYVDGGGGIALYESSPRIDQCTIAGNNAAIGGGYGGGILMTQGYSSPFITNCTFRQNNAGDGGGLALYSGTGSLQFLGEPIVINCLFVGNTTENSGRNGGGAVYTNAANGPLTLVNCTLTGNTALTANLKGGAILALNGAPVTITNSILWGNSPNEIRPLGDNASVTYSDVAGGWTGTGNLDANPRFVDAAGGDYGLAGCAAPPSPCVDAGNGAAMLFTPDLAGAARVAGAAVDMGAYEFVGTVTPPTITCPANITLTCPVDTLPATTGTATGAGCGSITVTYTDTETVSGNTTTITRTWVADNGAGTASCVQIITVNAPALSITCPADKTLTCPSDTSPTATGTATGAGCDTVTITHSDAQTVSGDTTTITRTWTASNGIDTPVSCVQTITVIAPALTITCPADKTLTCPSDTSPTATGTATGAGCGTVTITHSDAETVSGDTRVITRTWTASNGIDTPVSCVQTITVIAPALTITCPDNVTLTCPANTDPATTGTATGAGCGTVTITHSDAQTVSGDTTTITRTWVANNGIDTPVSCVQTITVIAPALSITCPADLTLTCPVNTDPATTGTATAMGCGTITVTHSDAQTVSGDTTTITRTWTANNGVDTPVSCVQTITVIAPALSITCPADLTLTCPANTDPATTGTATGAGCGTVTITHSDAQTVTGDTTTITRTWVANNGIDPPVSCVQTITVIAPALSITCPADKTLTCPSDTSPTATGTATATGCGTITVTHSDAQTVSGDTTTITRTWVANNGIDPAVSCVQTITVIAPALTIACPPDVTLTCPPNTDPATTGTATAAGCGTVEVEYSDEATTTGDMTVITRTWVANNGIDPAVSCVQTITVTTPPLTVTCPGDREVECDPATNAAEFAAWLAEAVGSNACGAATVTHDAGTLPTGCGDTTVTWTATDGGGQTAQCSATFTIIDTTPPTITPAADVVVGIDPGMCSASYVDLGSPAVMDACGVVGTATHDAPAVFPLGETTVTWTATDVCGNVGHATQLVTVSNLVPLAAIEFEQLIDIGETVAVWLDGAGSHDGEDANTDLQFLWTIDGVTQCDGFGDTCESMVLDMTYGLHTVTLRVTDRCGAFSETTILAAVSPAELSVLEISRALLQFYPAPPHLKLTGQVGLPLGVDFTEMDPQATATIRVAGTEVLPQTAVTFMRWGYEGRWWIYRNLQPPWNGLGLRQFDIQWSGNTYAYRDATFPVQMQSDLITTTETTLELRLRSKRLLPGPFTLDIGGQAQVSFDGDFNVTASTVPYVTQVPGRRVELTLPFPLTEDTDFTYAGSLNRVINAAPDLRPSLGRYSLYVNIDPALLPAGPATCPRQIELDLTLGTEQYWGTATVRQHHVIPMPPHHWRTNRCDEEDDD